MCNKMFKAEVADVHKYWIIQGDQQIHGLYFIRETTLLFT